MIRRILSILKSWIKGLLAPAKDPREGPTSARRRQEELLARVGDARERVEATRAHLERSMESGRGETMKLKDEARRLVGEDREDVARLVLRRRQAVVEHVRFLEEQADQIGKEAQTLSAVEYMLRSEVAACAAYEDAAEARLRAAEARVRVREALSGISDEFSDVSDVDERADYMRARADAMDELANRGALPSSAFSLVGGDLDEEVETALKELKR